MMVINILEIVLVQLIQQITLGQLLVLNMMVINILELDQDQVIQ